MAKLTLTERYEVYTNAFYDRKASIEARGGIPRMQKPYSFNEYQAQYNALRNERVLEGKRPGNINRDLISEQVYHYTYKQAQAFKESAGINPRMARLGLSKEQIDIFFNTIQNRYDELKQKGYKGKDASKIISVEYFGSPE